MTFARSSPPDIWVFESGETMKIPMAFLEVKTLKEGISHTNCFSQLFDCLLQSRELYGRREVFGIITNYLSWRIVWLPDCDSVARFPGESISSVPMVPTSGCSLPRVTLSEIIALASPPSRNIECSKKIHRNQPRLVPLGVQ